MSQPRSYLQFDGMVWPDPRDPTEVQWRLRYGDLTRQDRVRAASVLSAYAHLISMPRRLRDKRIRQLRAAMAANPLGEDTVPPDTDRRLYVVHAAYAEGWWGLTVPGVPGAVTQVRNLSDADKWASEAIAFVTGASLDDLVIEIVIVGGLAVPPEILRALDGLSARPARPARILPCPICGAPDGFHDGPPHADSLVKVPPPDWRQVACRTDGDIVHEYMDGDARPHTVRTKAGSQ